MALRVASIGGLRAKVQAQSHSTTQPRVVAVSPRELVNVALRYTRSLGLMTHA